MLTNTLRRSSAAAVLAVAAPALAQLQPFTEEAVMRGVNFSTPSGSSAGRGLAIADLDGDGDPDILAVGSTSGAFGLWENQGNGFFTSRIIGSGLTPISNASGVSLADFDGDGDLDVFVTRWDEPDKLYRNNGGFQFTDVSIAAGIDRPGRGTGSCWGDFDGDGDLDLYVCNMTDAGSPHPNRLFRNNGNGTFTDVAQLLGVADTGFSWHVGFIDYDLDGDLDIYLNNDKGQLAPGCIRHNRLFQNDGTGQFTDVTFAAGAEACADAMGMALGDFDGNGWPDIYITNTEGGNPLLLNMGDGTFVESEVEAGVTGDAIGWGTAFFDFDCDGDLDIYVCNQNAPNRLYVNDPEAWPCVDRAAELGVTATPVQFGSFVMAMGDVDLDGDLDLLIQKPNDRLRLFINHEGDRHNWLKLKVVGTGLNKFAYGARAVVTTKGRRQLRHVLGSGAYKNHNENTLHFGLGAATVADEIEVTWPGGESRTLRGYGANCEWLILPPSMMGDHDASGALDIADFMAFLNCFFGADRNMTPGCEAFDMDGSGRFDTSDFFEFVMAYFAP